jgi:hypothetical protein
MKTQIINLRGMKKRKLQSKVILGQSGTLIHQFPEIIRKQKIRAKIANFQNPIMKHSLLIKFCREHTSRSTLKIM